MCGAPDGNIVGWSAAHRNSPSITRVHTAAVRAWANTPGELAFKAGIDFATGDDAGFVAVWRDKAMAPERVKACAGGGHACGVQLVGRAAHRRGRGRWPDAMGHREHRDGIAREASGAGEGGRVGTWDDVLLIADGKGVEVWWTGAGEATGDDVNWVPESRPTRLADGRVHPPVYVPATVHRGFTSARLPDVEAAWAPARLELAAAGGGWGIPGE